MIRGQMKNKRKKIGMLVFLVIIGILVVVTSQTSGTIADSENYQCKIYATLFSLLPPVIAIGLALITKEVYTSLLAGIITGGLLYSNFNLELMLNTIFFEESGGMIYKLADAWNVGILVFLVMLGILVSLLNKAGGSAAFGKWASKHIKTRIGAQLSVMVLGILIFVDDYFNCLTVGSVLRPVTDRHKVSRAKLSYIIDATAAPVCIIAPISSWAAAVTSSVPEDAGINGFSVFIQTIPYNLYAILTLVMVFAVTVLRVDFGLMKTHEMNAMEGDIFTTPGRPYEDNEEEILKENAHVLDLVLPVAVLIVSCIVAMVYTGGFFRGASFVEAFADSDASVGLVLGGAVTLVFTFIYYMLRDVLTFQEFTECIPEGFKSMIAPILILTMAWTLSGMTNLLGAKVFVAELVSNSASAMQGFLPMIIFVVAALLAFATGRSDFDCFLSGRRSLRRPLLADIRYDNYGICRRTLRACQSCDNTASVCAVSCGCLCNRIFPDWISAGGKACVIIMDCASGMYPVAAYGSFDYPFQNRKRGDRLIQFTIRNLNHAVRSFDKR